MNYGEGFEGAEIDVAGGIRPEFGPLSLDLGYVHYFYAPDHVSPDYGEIFGKADYNFNDVVTVGARVFFAPDFNQSGNTATWVAGGFRVPLPNDFAVYAGIGYQFLEDPAGFEQLAWQAGVSYTWKSVTFDVRYIGTDLSDEGCLARSGFADGCESRVVGDHFLRYELVGGQGLDGRPVDYLHLAGKPCRRQRRRQSGGGWPTMQRADRQRTAFTCSAVPAAGRTLR